MNFLKEKIFGSSVFSNRYTVEDLEKIIKKNEPSNKYLTKYKKRINEQIKIETKKHLKHCEYTDLDYYLSSLNIEDFDKFISDNFTDTNVMDSISCLLSNIQHQEINDYFKGLKIISDNSRGYILSSNKVEHNFSVIKITKGTPYSIYHEYFIGRGLNKLRRLGNINLSYTYALIDCNMPYINKNGVGLCLCKTDKNQVKHLFTEMINPGISVKNSIQNMSVEDYLMIYLQVLFSINHANREIEFWHGNLTVKNVLIRETNENDYYMKYDRYIKCNGKIATIINYECASFKGNGQYFSRIPENYQPATDTNTDGGAKSSSKISGSSKDQDEMIKKYYSESYIPGISFAINDMYKFLISTLIVANKKNNRGIIDAIAPLISYFHKENIDELIKKISDKDINTIVLPPIKKYLDYDRFKKFFDHSLKVLKPYNLVTKEKQNKVLKCCETTVPDDVKYHDFSHFLQTYNKINSTGNSQDKLTNELTNVEKLFNNFDLERAIEILLDTNIPNKISFPKIESNDENYTVMYDSLDNLAQFLDQYENYETKIQDFNAVSEIYLKIKNRDINSELNESGKEFFKSYQEIKDLRNEYFNTLKENYDILKNKKSNDVQVINLVKEYEYLTNMF